MIIFSIGQLFWNILSFFEMILSWTNIVTIFYCLGHFFLSVGKCVFLCCFFNCLTILDFLLRAYCLFAFNSIVIGVNSWCLYRFTVLDWTKIILDIHQVVESFSPWSVHNRFEKFIFLWKIKPFTTEKVIKDTVSSYWLDMAEKDIVISFSIQFVG